MGIPGAGKTRVAQEYVARGYVRLNRDERGGALRELAEALDAELTAGGRRVVLDNTYLTRAARSCVIEAATRHGLPTRCVWLDTPLAHAQVNLVERMLAQFDTLPTPDQLRDLARRHAGVLAPTSQMRTFRELEPPSIDEGFAGIETIAFARAPLPASLPARATGAGVFVAAAALERPDWEDAIRAADPPAPHLLFHWSPDAAPDALAPAAARLAAEVSGRVEQRALPAPRRTPDVLVPAAPPGPPARVRARPQPRPGALGPDRNRTRAPQSRRGARRALHPGLTPQNSGYVPAGRGESKYSIGGMEYAGSSARLPV